MENPESPVVGRPKIEHELRRQHVSATVSPATKRKIKELSKLRGLSTGALFDQLLSVQ